MKLTFVFIWVLIVRSHSMGGKVNQGKCKKDPPCMCNTAHKITNGSVVYSDNTTAWYICQSGRIDTIDCKTDESGVDWETANCSAQDCSDPVPQHGAANSTITALGAILKVTCDSSYHLSGNAKIDCQANGTWSYNSTCKIIGCSDPVPLYGVNNSTNTTFGTVLEFMCEDGNNLSANAIITCQANGSWSFNPTCETIISSSSTTESTTAPKTTVVQTESNTTLNSTVVPTESTTTSNSTVVQTESNTTTDSKVVPYPDNKSTIVITVTVTVVVVLICAIIVVILLIRRRRKQVQTTVKFNRTLEREPGNSISTASRGNQITNISANGHVPDDTSNAYAQIVDSGIRINEQNNEYQTIDDIHQIKPSGNASYSHIKSKTATVIDSNYSHVENTKKVKSKTVDYGFLKFKRGISAMKKSINKNADNSYDELEMKTVLCDSSKNVEDVAVAELESEYNQTQSKVPKSIKNDIQNKQDEYSHLNYKPTSFNPNINEEVIKDAPRKGKPKFNPVLQPKIGGNVTEHADVIRHDYLELEPVGESGEDSINDNGQPKFEEIKSDGTYGFQYECAKEIHQNENQRNEDTETKENRRENVLQYEFAKPIDSTSDLEIKSTVDKGIPGSNETTEGENPCHYYFTLSKT